MNTTNQAIERLAFCRFGHLGNHLSALEKYPKNTFTRYLFTRFGSHKCHSEVTLKTLKDMAAHSWSIEDIRNLVQRKFEKHPCWMQVKIALTPVPVDGIFQLLPLLPTAVLLIGILDGFRRSRG
jgi:hypothetical protein